MIFSRLGQKQDVDFGYFGLMKGMVFALYSGIGYGLLEEDTFFIIRMETFTMHLASV